MHGQYYNVKVFLDYGADYLVASLFERTSLGCFSASKFVKVVAEPDSLTYMVAVAHEINVTARRNAIRGLMSDVNCSLTHVQ